MADRPSAATWRRRRLRASIPACGQASTPANPSEANSCSTHQAVCFPACRTTIRSSANPAAAQAGACGKQGGVTSASQPPSADRRARAGSSSETSPKPLLSTRNSVRLPRGQPPPGNSASSSACPLGIVSPAKLAKVSPRQTSPLARTSAKGLGNGTQFMTRG